MSSGFGECCGILTEVRRKHSAFQPLLPATGQTPALAARPAAANDKGKARDDRRDEQAKRGAFRYHVWRLSARAGTSATPATSARAADLSAPATRSAATAASCAGSSARAAASTSGR